jgi:isoleucyl-tRNA synthetase
MASPDDLFPRYANEFGLPAQEEAILAFWDEQEIFQRVADLRAGSPHFVFYEGPPTANGRPGIHHVISRTIKDLVCRYRTMKGFRVDRKGGWDTHGLPVELEVEKKLGLATKAKIEEYGIAEFNRKCKESVFTYLQDWNRLTRRMGFWLDLKDPYITFTNEYIESVWWILAQLFKRDLLYNGNRVVAYCPRCETAQSSHEVAQGYREVEDPSVFVTMPLVDEPDTAFLVWTTTPWTLISNVALALSADAVYARVRHRGTHLILAEALLDSALEGEYDIVDRYKGSELAGRRYTPLFTFFPDVREAGYVTLTDDFVSLSEGTGIVHMAPAYGEDDHRIGKEHGLPMPQPLDRTGRFVASQVPDYGGKFFKEADPEITKKLKSDGRLYKVGTYAHTYPFCWRCDSPLIYMARPSWYVRTTRMRDQLQKNNEQIRWCPPEIGRGRFGEWLEGNVDWALSRDRFWGTPLNIWICGECGAAHALESIAELRARGENVPAELDLHKPWVDDITLACKTCKGTMRRTPEVIDVWFDSGAMPIAQWHYPFENAEKFDSHFPADFISEAVDQTRGWFYSLLAISTLLFDRPAFKNVVVMEMVLDKNGQKMSKSKGNVVDPWQVIDEVGIDPLRWYMLTASQPWIPLKFDMEGPREAARKFFSTLNNTYAFFALYANVDRVAPEWLTVRPDTLTLFDRWLLSRLNSLVRLVDRAYDAYDLTRALRAIQNFVTEELSNWYVRRSRRRFWVAAAGPDKRAAFYTLYAALSGVVRIMAPAAPFLADRLYRDLVGYAEPGAPVSVHLTDFPAAVEAQIDVELERSMALAMEAVSLGRAARAVSQLKVRQPLRRLVLLVPGAAEAEALERVKDLVADEVNTKEVEFTLTGDAFRQIRVVPVFPKLGPVFGKRVNVVAEVLKNLDSAAAARFESEGRLAVHLDGEETWVTSEMVQFKSEAAPGWALAQEGRMTAAVDTRLDDGLILEGLARELVNRIQNMRKEAGFDVTDRITLDITGPAKVLEAFESQRTYILQETLTVEVTQTGREGEFQRRWPLGEGEATLSVSRKEVLQQRI